MNCVNMSKIQMQKGKPGFIRNWLHYIFENKLNVTYILANDFGKFYGVNNYSSRILRLKQ